MDFKEFLPDGANSESEDSEEIDVEGEAEKETEKIGPEQFYDVITSRKPDWQSLIYELINSEQLDPWDIDIVVLTKKYFERIAEMEENLESGDESGEEVDFYISSKVLLAAALLLRIKSEFLLNKYIKSIDEILFGKKDEKKYVLEKIEINEDELPLLIPKTPLPRARRITLSELMNALNKAINTESRRIKREVSIKRAKKLSEIDFPTFRRTDLKDRIRQFYARILTSLKKTSNGPEKNLNKVCYSHLAGKEKEEKISCFLPVLHLSNSKKLWLEQEKHLDEIWIYLYEYFDKNRKKFIEELEKDIEDMKEELTVESGENLDAETESKVKKAQKKMKMKQELAEEARKELEEEIKKEIKEINKEEKIDKISGFESA